MKKKSQVTIYITGFISLLLIVLVAGFLSPLGARFTAAMIAAGEDQLLMANESISNIKNETIRTAVMNVIGEAFDAGQTNIEVTTDIFQYLWVIALVIVGLILFLYSRRLVEVGGNIT